MARHASFFRFFCRLAFCCVRSLLFVSIVAVTASVIASPAARADQWDLGDDFSTASNPNGAWRLGSKTALFGSFQLFTNNTRVTTQYGTSQLAGWSDPAIGAFPYILSNVSNQNWIYDGTPAGGGIVILQPGDIMMHPFSAPSRFSVAQWTAPTSGVFALDVAFARFEQVQGRNSTYCVLRNNAPLPGGCGTLTGFGTPTSSAHFAHAGLALLAGDRLEFAVGFGTDGNSNADGTTVRATIVAVPEPNSCVLAVISIALISRRWLRRNLFLCQT